MANATQRTACIELSIEGSTMHDYFFLVSWELGICDIPFVPSDRLVSGIFGLFLLT